MKQLILKGNKFELPSYGIVIFEGLDYYMGECTVKLRGVTYPGTYYPKIELLEKDFEFVE